MEADCEIGGKAVRLRVLRDTGNTLRDGMTGAPVLVVEGAQLLPLWPEAVQKCLAEGMAHPAEVLTAVERCPGAPRFRLLPFRSVGTAEGLAAFLHGAAREDRALLRAGSDGRAVAHAGVGAAGI